MQALKINVRKQIRAVMLRNKCLQTGQQLPYTDEHILSFWVQHHWVNIYPNPTITEGLIDWLIDLTMLGPAQGACPTPEADSGHVPELYETPGEGGTISED